MGTEEGNRQKREGENVSSEATEKALLFLIRMVIEQEAMIIALKAAINTPGISLDQTAQANVAEIVNRLVRQAPDSSELRELIRKAPLL